MERLGGGSRSTKGGHLMGNLGEVVGMEPRWQHGMGMVVSTHGHGGHVDVNIWLHDCMGDRIGLIWDINSYPQVQRTGWT